MDLLVRDGDKVANTPETDRFLVFASYLGDAGFAVDKVEEFLVGSMGWATGTKL